MSFGRFLGIIISVWEGTKVNKRKPLSVTGWLAIGLAVHLTACLSASDETKWTLAGTGNWSDPRNWTAGVPVYDSYAEINNGGTAEITAGTADCRMLWIGRWAAEFGPGHVRQTGGRLTIRDYLSIGYSVSGSSSYVLEGMGELRCDYEYVGYQGAGTFIQTSGDNRGTGFPFRLSVGYLSNAIGRYELSGGTLVAYEEVIGYEGSGTFSQTSGANTTSYVIIAQESGSSGEYRISADSVLSASVILCHGTFEVLGGSASINSRDLIFDGELVTRVDETGISTINVSQTASLGCGTGTWNVVDEGAPFGRFNVVVAAGGVSGGFREPRLPGPDWAWGLDGGTLWLEHIPEPATLSLLALGGLAMIRRRRK